MPCKRRACPSAQELFDRLISLLLEQVRIDATQQIASLAENRLGLSGPITSVRQAARSMGLTRARVYQLLNEINDIMAVRWPHGRHQMYELREKLLSEAKEMESPPDLQQFLAAVELFYPGSRRGAAGPLEYMLGEEEDEHETSTRRATRPSMKANWSGRSRSFLPERPVVGLPPLAVCGRGGG